MVYFGKKHKKYNVKSSSQSTNNTPLNTAESSQFSGELSPESAQYASTAANVATSAGMSAGKIGAIVGVSAAVATAVLTTVIVTSVVLSASKGLPSDEKITFLGYMANCSNPLQQCNTLIGLTCLNETCQCNSNQYYNGSYCGQKLILFYSNNYF
jgi:hypothetical protein